MISTVWNGNFRLRRVGVRLASLLGGFTCVRLERDLKAVVRIPWAVWWFLGFPLTYDLESLIFLGDGCFGTRSHLTGEGKGDSSFLGVFSLIELGAQELERLWIGELGEG